jgi:hypothetical protein
MFNFFKREKKRPFLAHGPVTQYEVTVTLQVHTCVPDWRVKEVIENKLILFGGAHQLLLDDGIKLDRYNAKTRLIRETDSYAEEGL